MERLSHEDEAILSLESPTVAGHTCKLLLVAESASSGRWVEILRRQVAARLPDAPRLRQRLVRTPLGIAPPAWIEDPEFDIANHVRPLPGAGGARLEDVPALVAEVMSGRLPRDRPLWSLDVIDPLSDGAAALIWRIHHCMADGTAALRLGKRVLWDSAPWTHATTVGRTPPTAPIPGRGRLLLSGLSDRIRQTDRSSTEKSHRPTRERVRQLAATIKRELLPGPDPSPFDAPVVTAKRGVAFASAPLETFKHFGQQLEEGATINDVLLAIVAGALRRWLTAHGENPIPIRAKVPVSLHHGDQLANRDSFFCVDLPLDESSPLRRLRLIRDETRLRKSEHDAQALDLILHEPSGVPRVLERFLQARADDPRVAALCISNVPGPSAPVFVSGSQVQGLYSLADIGPHHALRIAAVSLDGVLSLAFCADPSAVSNLRLLADAVEEELATL